MTDITVCLNKERGESLGIGFKKLSKPPHCEVSILVDHSVAAVSGQIQQGDLLLGVNGINVQHLSPTEVGGVLARHSTDPTITLDLRRPEANEKMNNLTNALTNGHPTIVVQAHSPPPDVPEQSSPTSLQIENASPASSPSISPSVSPSVSPVMGRRNRNPRVRRSNVMAGGIAGLPEIQEGVGESEGSPKNANLNINPHPTHRHSLTPEAIRKPIDNIKRATPLRGSKSLDLANLPQWRSGGSSQSVTVHNLLNGHEMSDRLHTNRIKVCGRTIILWVKSWSVFHIHGLHRICVWVI